MADKSLSWPEIPPRVAGVLEPELPGLAEEILATIAREVPEYARPFEGSFGRGIRVGVSEALSQFTALIADPGAGRGPGGEVYFELGRGELRQGRSLDSLQAAYRVGARVAWQRISRAGEAAGLEPRVLYALADAIFAYIDELSAESVEGYAAEQSAREGAREVRRGRLLAGLAQDPPADSAELERLADEADWKVPAEVAALVCRPGRASRIGRGLPVDTVAGRIDGLGCLVVPDPEGPGVAAALAGACREEPAALGPAVRPGSFDRSLEDARATWQAIEQEAIAAEAGAGPVRSDEHLVELVMLAGRPRLERLAARLLAPLDEETDASRERLLETLASHLRHQGRVAPVAAELHVHPQTVRYRVGRLRELLGERLDDPDGRFGIEAALRARTP